ncbi:MAG: HNH endonuclease signature motif containing protein [Caldilineaceae bacterium]
MPIFAADREFLRRRAQFACEYCGVREADVGNALTIDHFRPRSVGGTDDLENLIYSCVACNQYMHNYWAESTSEPQLWNPRQDPFARHFIQLNDGTLQPLTKTGAFSLQLLHLNRSPLIEYRQSRQRELTKLQSLSQLQALVQIYEHLLEQQSQLIAQQRKLLEKQHELLQHIISERLE